MGRLKVRFKPDSNAVAWLTLEKGDEKFYVGLVDDESIEGVGLVVNQTIPLEIGEQCFIQVDKLSPLKAELRWKKQVDDNIFRMGFYYLE